MSSKDPSAQTPLYRQLVELGQPPSDSWQDYVSLGIGEEQIPELRAIVANESEAVYDLEEEAWVSLHAWRALAQLRDHGMLDDLIELLIENPDDDWLRDDLITILPLLGPRCLPRVRQELDRAQKYDDYESVFPLLEGTWTLAQKYVEARRPVIQDFGRRLERGRENDPDYNGFLIIGLCKLNARDALPTIAVAFVNGAVDEQMTNWEDVVASLKLPESAKPTDFA